MNKEERMMDKGNYLDLLNYIRKVHPKDRGIIGLKLEETLEKIIKEQKKNAPNSSR